MDEKYQGECCVKEPTTKEPEVDKEVAQLEKNIAYISDRLGLLATRLRKVSNNSLSDDMERLDYEVCSPLANQLHQLTNQTSNMGLAVQYLIDSLEI